MHTAAHALIKRLPFSHEYAGWSYEDASRMAQAICVAAGETGQTVNATAHLNELVAVMKRVPLHG